MLLPTQRFSNRVEDSFAIAPASQGLILGQSNLLSLIGVNLAEAGALAGVGINAVRGSAANAPANQAVSWFHAIFSQPRKIKRTGTAV